MPMADELRTLLRTLDPKARDDLRRILIRDQADRDAIASRLMRYRDRTARIGPTSSTSWRCIRVPVGG
jgi:hypothetical protein